MGATINKGCCSVTVINNISGGTGGTGGGATCITQDFTVDQANGLPLSATLTSGITTDTLWIDVDNMTSDFTISAWIPTDLSDCAIVRVRKIDTSTNRIIWNDGVHNYRFVNRKGEFLTFRYDLENNILIII